MGSEKYKLKWSKYESNILSAFHGLLESENLSDVTLFCEGQTFKAHRLVLAACSTHFDRLFSISPVQQHTQTMGHNQFFVILDGTRADDLQILLHFMYRGEAYLHQDRINSVLRTAEILQVKGLSDGPRNIEINNQTSGGNRSWSPGEASPRHHNHGRKADSPLLRRPLPSGSPTPMAMHHHPPLSPNYPSSYSSTREPFPMFSGGGLRPASFARHHDYSPPPPSSQMPPPRSKSPLPRPPSTSTSSTVNYPSKFISSSSVKAESSVKDSDTNLYRSHTPKNDSTRSSPSQHKPGSNATSPTASNSEPITSNLLRPSLDLLHHRVRRASDPGGAMETEDSASVASDDHPGSAVEVGVAGTKFQTYRGQDEDLVRRIPSRSPSERNPDPRIAEEEMRSQVAAATSLETFRRMVEREREQQLRAGILSSQRGGSTATLPIGPGLTASDYMRFAMPVREDGGDAISGSGTKLRCPFCERTYGYETNLRAHIRQRHQGIRVSCPYCPRTFTRNNTVRRHVQREHRHLVGRIPTKFGSTRVMPDPITAVAAAAVAAQHQQHQQQRPVSPGENKHHQ